VSRASRRPILLRALLAAASLSIAQGGHASEVGDASIRAEYGFYSGEPGALGSAIASLERESPDETPGLRKVQLAYALWKQAELQAADESSAAVASAAACVEQVDEVAAARWPEAEAVASACYGLLARLDSVIKAPLNGRRSGRSIAAALEMAPDNPRVRLIDARNDYERPSAFGGDKDRAHRKLREAVAAFEAEGPAVDDSPHWGHAEALAWLGRSHLERGDRVAARESLERALIIAPDYRWARTLLDQLDLSR
jgi:tetratricopeptide (TPR) repeat protein